MFESPRERQNNAVNRFLTVYGIVFSLTLVKLEGIERSEIFDGLVFMRSGVYILLIGFERFLKVC